MGKFRVWKDSLSNEPDGKDDTLLIEMRQFGATGAHLTANVPSAAMSENDVRRLATWLVEAMEMPIPDIPGATVAGLYERASSFMPYILDPKYHGNWMFVSSVISGAGNLYRKTLHLTGEVERLEKEKKELEQELAAHQARQHEGEI